MSELLRRLTPSRAELFDGAAILAMTVIALVSFGSSYGGATFLVVGATAAAALIGVAHVGIRLGWPVLAIVVAAVVVYVLLCTWLALGHYALAAVVPTPKSITRSLFGAVTGWKELITTAPPVGRTGDLMVLPVFVGATSGFVSYTLARRVRWVGVALIAPFVALALGIATGTNEPVSVLVNGAAFVMVAVGWMSAREHRNRPLLSEVRLPRRQVAMAVGMLFVAGAVGLAAAPRLPFADTAGRAIWRQTVTPPFDPREYPSPLTSYRTYVKSGEVDVDLGERINSPVVLTVEGLPESVPIRMATMDAYDGLVWQVSSGDPANPSLDDSGSFERVGARLDPEFEGEIAEVAITIGEYTDVWIPDVGEVISFRFEGSEGGAERDRELANSFRYNRATDTAATPVRLQPGDRYEMTVRLPELVDDVTGLELIPTQRVGETVSIGEVVAKLNSPDLSAMSTTNERLDAVTDLMVTYGAYTDGDESLGQYRARSGHNAKRLADFVQDFPKRPLVGNAEQYASAYALLFRDLDRVPTRVVMGFMPSASSVDEPVDVVATEVESWVEVPVEGAGWVAIFPTPPRDNTEANTSSPQQPEPDYRTQNPPAPPLLDPEFDQPATTKGRAQATVDEPAAEDEIASDESSMSGVLDSPIAIGVGLALSPLLVLLVFGSLIVGLKAIRRRRRRSRGAPHQRISNGWREVTDLATDLGRPVPSSTTRREAAAFASVAAKPLADRTDAAVWGGAELSDGEVDAYWDDLVETLDAMRSEVGRFDRFKAAISLHSFRRRKSREGGGT